MAPRHLCRFTLLVAWMAVSGCTVVAQGVLSKDEMGVVDCAALREAVSTPRWLSLPESRLVINPFFGEYMGHSGEQSDSKNGVLPLDLAYYVGSRPVALPNFCVVQEKSDAGLPSSPRVVAGPRLSLSDAAGWQVRGVTASFRDAAAEVTPTGDFGAIVRTVTVDLDQTPCLLVQTPPGSPAFDMKVNGGADPVDTLLKPTAHLGAIAANVATATGWHGIHTFQVLLYALGKGHSLSLKRIQFFGFPNPLASGAVAARTQIWMPHQIEETACWDNFSASMVTGTVTLPDASSVAERFHIVSAGHSTFVLSGTFPGTARWDAPRHTLRLSGRGFGVALALNAHVRWLGVRPTTLDWAVGDGKPADSGVGVWRLAITGLRPSADLVLAARFTPSPDAGQIGDAVRQEATVARFEAACVAGEAAWNRRLARVPRPRDFTPRGIDAKGVTPTEVRRSYYRAWVFLYADTLPPMPENGSNYPQVCAGKPSLWTDGAPHSEETAVWDSAVAMQALALVEPETAGDAASSIMMQVDAEGYLPGELLPTVLAQTFYDLYEQTGDRTRLRSVYPALKRFLVWRIAHPRWVWPNKSRADVKPSTGRSNEFVVHEIIDMGFAARIAATLGMPEERDFWNAQRRQAAADFVRWFWATPSGPTYEDYDIASNSRGGEDIAWTLKGLGIGTEILPAPERQHLLAVFQRRFDAARSFGISQNRFGDIEPITLGLFDSGDVVDARRMADTALRDVTRAGEFSEDYTGADPPRPGGVRPSVFGARTMMDSILWHNGVVLDEGLPVVLGMPGAVGVDNIPVRGDAVSVHFNGAAHTVTLRGAGLSHLTIPTTFRVVREVGGTIVWTGPIAEGARIPLTASD